MIQIIQKFGLSLLFSPYFPSLPPYFDAIFPYFFLGFFLTLFHFFLTFLKPTRHLPVFSPFFYGELKRVKCRDQVLKRSDEMTGHFVLHSKIFFNKNSILVN